MVFDLNFAEVARAVYNVPISYLIFYYLMLFSVVSIIKNSMEIHIEYLKAEFGIFKLDENSVPALLFVGWFGFMYELISYLDFLPNKEILIMCSSALFVVGILFLRTLKAWAQWTTYYLHKLRGNQNIQKGRLIAYSEWSSKQFNSMIIDTLLFAFCVTFSLVKFELLSIVFTVGIMIVYAGRVAAVKSPKFFKSLHGWE